jgi:hypothetical protein
MKCELLDFGSVGQFAEGTFFDALDFAGVAACCVQSDW